MDKKVQAVLLKIIYKLYSPVNFIYWWMVENSIKSWGESGLHLVSVGEFITSGWKARSLYRETMLLKSLPLFLDLRGKSCLDLACNDGFWAFRLGRFGLKSVVGIDVQKKAIQRADFLKTVYNFSNFEFKFQDLFQYLYRNNTETFDLILLLSIIYHLPEQTDWNRFFKAISQINNECLVIDTRWFDDDDYWYDKTSGQAILHTEQAILRKWRPTRKEVFFHLNENGYQEVVEFNPAAFLADQKDAYGNGDPYTRENISDYITNHRSIVIAYKDKSTFLDIKVRLDAISSGYRTISKNDAGNEELKPLQQNFRN